MASIARAASKATKDRRNSDQVRLQAGHMLTFDDLAVRQDIAERHVMKKVVRKKILRANGCMQLPMTLAMFLSFACSGFWHEDITNVFFVESGMRASIDEIFEDVKTIDDWWAALLGTSEQGFVGWLFKQTDDYGKNLTKGEGDDGGNWGRLALFNQLQGGVRFEMSRRTTANFGTDPFTCSTELESEMCMDDKDNGFFAVGSLKDGIAANLSELCIGSNRLLQEVSMEHMELRNREHARPTQERAERRLFQGETTLRSFLPQFPSSENESFRFHIYPGEPLPTILARLNYYRHRGWLDTNTEVVRVSMYFLNAELGRPRLEQVRLTFYFNDAGEVVYERRLLPILLQFYPHEPWQTLLTMFFDFLFSAILFITTLYRLCRLWTAFANKQLFDHVIQLSTAWEWIIIALGWGSIQRLWGLTQQMVTVVDLLIPVRQFGWQTPPTAEMHEANNEFFNFGQSSAESFYDVNMMWGIFSIILMFRFFASFGSQPRLALVTNTIKAVMVDLVHFMIMLVPTWVAYALSGTLLFGRRIYAFNNPLQSLMTCFRIMIESEYPWEELSAEWYITAGLWSWSFVVVLCLLMINMVLAIILDVYNEVHEGSVASETVWETLRDFFTSLVHLRNWVSNKALAEKLQQSFATHAMIEKEDLKREFPKIPSPELDLLFRQCRKDMVLGATKDLDKKNMVKLSGGMMVTVDKMNKTVTKINNEESDDPIKSWVQPNVGKASEALKDLTENFLTTPISAKGGKCPHLEAPDAEREASREKGTKVNLPDWFKEVEGLLSEQEAWMEYTTWQMQNMQWQLQVAHLAHHEGGAKSPSALDQDLEESVL